MKISLKGLVYDASENVGKAFAEGTRAEPVESASRLRAALAQAFAQRRLPYGKGTAVKGRGERAGKPENDEGSSARAASGGERRHHDRRQQAQPVLLDTRLGQRRQDAARSAPVNLAI